MASISKMQTTKDGRRYWKISVSRGYGKTPYTTRYYWPDGWAKTSVERGLKHAASDFEAACAAGNIQNRAERAQIEAEARAALEALKTVRQYSELVFMPKKELNIAENTRISYWSNLNGHILPVLGKLFMKDVTPAMISKLLTDFQKSHSYGSTVKVYNILNGIFKMAYRDDTIEKNPMDKVDRPKQKKDDKCLTEADKALHAEELNYVLECVEQEPLKWQAFVYLAADTGCRRGELVGIQWSDIDFKKKTVTIKHNLQYSKAKKTALMKNNPQNSRQKKTDDVIYDGVYDVTPKGGKFRKVDLGDDTIAVLKKFKAELTKPDECTTEKEVVNINEYRQQQKTKDEKTLPKWVFTIDGSDLPMFPHSPTRYFKTFGETYNVPGFHPHMLRHTSASLSLTNGGDVKSVADRLGHADASVTLRMYAHANDESIRAAGQAARDALKRQREEQKNKKENAGA